MANEPTLNEPTTETENLPAPDVRALVTITHAVYALQAIGLFTMITFVVGVIINYVKRDEAQATWVGSHFRWQIRTFWFGLLWAALGILTFILVIGYLILIADMFWVMYRVIKGWLYLVDRKPLYGVGHGERRQYSR